MKKLFTLFAMAFFAILFAPDHAKASHMAGVDITYEWTGNPNEYLVRLKFYRDCVGISAPTQVTICYSSLSTGQNGSVIAPNVSSTPVPNTACVTTAPTCPGGVGDIEEYVYETIILLPGQAPDWTFSWADCCRNGAITTLQPNGMYISCTLDNIIAPTNSSPSFLNLAYTRFCVGNQFFYDQGASDIDGDSLVFSLVTAEDGGFGCPNNPFPNTYIAPYSPTNPLASSIPITIDPATGVVNFIPALQQVAVICVLVREYRNGVLIGQVKRDIQINILAQCNQIFPSFVNSVLTAGGGQIIASCNDYQVIIPFDTTFQCASAVPTDFRIIGPFGIPNPAVAVQPINCSNGETDSLLVTFLNPLSAGETFIWIKRGFDGNTLLSECGSEIPEFQDTVRILVTDNSIWTPVTDSISCVFNDFTVTLSDSIYCFSVALDGTDIQLVDGAGTNYPIANAYGYCTPGGLKTNQLLVEMGTTTSATGPFYLVITNTNGSDGNTLANNCGRFLTNADTLAILYLDNVIPVNLGADSTICSFDPIPTLDCQLANLTYQWYDQAGAITGATAQTYTPTAAGSYYVVVNSGAGCSGSDTVAITIIPAALDNLGNDPTLCSYDPMPTLDAGNPGATYQWYNNGVIIPGATSQTYTPASQPAGSYTYSVSVDNGNALCIGNFDVIINRIDPPVLAVVDQDICTDQQATLDAGVAGGTYLWSNGGNSQTINTNVAGNYVVTVTVNNCSSTDTAVVNVFTYPVAPIVACNPGTGPFKFVYVWAAVGSAASYEVSEDGGATWIVANVPTGPESHGVNTNIPNFLVRAIGSGLCKIGAQSEPVACEVTIPNIFTPNGDNTNEFFELENIEQYPNNTVQIFNRWGKEVFSTSGYNNTTKKFDGKDLPDGVYFYIVDLGDGTTEPKAGTVTINR
ncbi:MAG: gliding motility-associated C-terminal domain-containing protein [Bacteroidetes bacterium]|nr:gliding motility-associated C-terminal domain-containing protein [Bacteroidota bacterium]